MSDDLITVLIWSSILFHTTEKKNMRITVTTACQLVVYTQVPLHKDSLLYYTVIQMSKGYYFPTYTLMDWSLCQGREGREQQIHLYSPYGRKTQIGVHKPSFPG
jgi:hypothetical protein